ncbi:MAG: hypothetical protein ACFBSE_04275 [Prochloraceae cyanobacterium]
MDSLRVPIDFVCYLGMEIKILITFTLLDKHKILAAIEAILVILGSMVRRL